MPRSRAYRNRKMIQSMAKRSQASDREFLARPNKLAYEAFIKEHGEPFHYCLDGGYIYWNQARIQKVKGEQDTFEYNYKIYATYKERAVSAYMEHGGVTKEVAAKAWTDLMVAQHEWVTKDGYSYYRDKDAWPSTPI